MISFDTISFNPSSKDKSDLSRLQAIERSSVIHSLRYSLYLKLTKYADDYIITTDIYFRLSADYEASLSLFLDFSGKFIISLYVNSSCLTNHIKPLWKNNLVTLPSSTLFVGEENENKENHIQFVTRSDFSKDGTGLFSYLEGNQQYIYSLFVSNNCHKVFPCFDQPDLKAIFNLKVECPQDWNTFSNEPILNRELNEIEGRKVCEFKPTKLISTYHFAIIAGDFKVIEAPKNFNYQSIPLRLACKSSSFHEMQLWKDEIFEITNFGLKFYEEFFQHPFPFEKYDQIFCPEFNFLAMENPGAVCLIDSYLFSENVACDKRTARCLTILHELAHMWFGNLVTMKWWDDIWLNESFAVYISHYCLEKLIALQDNKIYFDAMSMMRFLFYKRDGFEEDCLEATTHPIRQKVETTEQSNDIFNSITYAKGAAVIKQLVFLINEKKFSDSLKQYFEKFKWKNADSNDLFQIIAENVPNLNLHEWKVQWLESASLNRIQIKEVDLNSMSLVLNQTSISPEFPLLRRHSFKIAVFYLNNENQLSFKVLPCQISSEESIVKFDEDFLPALTSKNHGFLLNYEDHGYFKSIMDPASSIFFQENISYFECKLSKSLILLSFYDMIIELQLSPLSFLEIVRNLLLTDQEMSLFGFILTYTFRVIDNYLPKKVKDEESSRIFKILLSFLADPTCSSSKCLVIKEHISLFARKEEDIKILVDIVLRRSELLKHITTNSYILTHTVELIFFKKLLSESERTEIFKRYVEHNRYYRLFCEITTLPSNQKAKTWDSFISLANEESLYLRTFAMKGFNNEFNEENIEIINQKFFEDVSKVFASGNRQYAKTFYKLLFPKSENFEKILEKMREVLAKEADEGLKWLMREKIQIVEIKRKVVRFYFG